MSENRANESPAAEADLFDLALVGHAVLFALRSPLRHPWMACAAFLVVMSAAVTGLVLFPQRYEVTTTILAGSPLTGALVGDRERERDLPTRAAREILLSRENLEELAREINFAERYLAERPPAIRFVHGIFDAINGKERDAEAVLDSLVETLEDRLWVTAYPEGTVVIGLQWWDTQIAYDLVSAAANSFLEMRHSAEISTIAESITILEGHRDRLAAKVNAEIERIEKRENSENKSKSPATRTISAPTPNTDSELRRLQLLAAENRRSIAERQAAREQRLLQLQSELLQQQTIYAPDHPAIAATQRMIDLLQGPSTQLAELRDEGRRLEQEIARRGGANGGRSVAASTQAMEPLPLLFDQDPREEHERAQLRHMRGQLSELTDRIITSRLQLETAEAAFKHRYAIVTPPRIPKGPVKPYGMMFLVGGFAGGLLFALLVAVTLDLVRGHALERWQIEHQLGLPVLGDARE